MHVLIAHLESLSPYSQSKPSLAWGEDRRQEGESHEAAEERLSRRRLHLDGDEVIVPAYAFKSAISDASRFCDIKKSGRSKWGKDILTGIFIPDPLHTGVHKDQVRWEWRFMDSEGKRGGSKRVWRCYPEIDRWEGDLKIYVLSADLSGNPGQHVLEEHVRLAGMFIGVGRYRVINGGHNGRFKPTSFQWSEEA